LDPPWPPGAGCDGSLLAESCCASLLRSTLKAASSRSPDDGSGARFGRFPSLGFTGGVRGSKETFVSTCDTSVIGIT
jgi:hypothetical protein